MSVKIRNLSDKTMKLSQHLQYISSPYINEVTVFQQQNILFLFVRAQSVLFFSLLSKNLLKFDPSPFCVLRLQEEKMIYNRAFSPIFQSPFFPFLFAVLDFNFSNIEMGGNSPPAE